MMMELGLILAILVPAGLLLGFVMLNRSRRRIERDGADYSGFGSSSGGTTWIGTETGSRDSNTSTSYINADTGSGWDSGSNSSCDSGSSGDSGGGGGCD